MFVWNVGVQDTQRCIYCKYDKQGGPKRAMSRNENTGEGIPDSAVLRKGRQICEDMCRRPEAPVEQAHRWQEDFKLKQNQCVQFEGDIGIAEGAEQHRTKEVDNSEEGEIQANGKATIAINPVSLGTI